MNPNWPSIVEDAKYLSQVWLRGQVYYDEIEGVLQEHTAEGVMKISAPYLDEPTYYLSWHEGVLQVRLQALDNYKRHLKAKLVDLEMRLDDWEILAKTLSGLAYAFRSFEQLKRVDLKSVWIDLLDALFVGPEWGQRPSRLPRLVKESNDLAKKFCAMLKKNGCLVEWEWKNWSDPGVANLNALPQMRQRGVVIPYPSPQEAAEVCDSDVFSCAVLTWFDGQLVAHGMTLIAISPIDEHQKFALVPRETIDELRASLDTLCIRYVLAANYTV